MTNSQKIALRISQVRKRLNEISGLEGDAMTDEVRSEAETLQSEYSDLETRAQAAIIAEGEPATTTDDGEGRELRGLIERADLASIYSAVLEHSGTEGATAELQQHFNVSANQIPLAMLETRAVTPAPANVGQNQSEIIPGVFPQAAASFLGIDMPTVGVGEAVYPVLTKNADVHTPAENAESADTTGSFSADVLSPARLQAAFFYSREDKARFAGMAEALRANLNDALADALDKQILVGTEGLLTGTNLANNAQTTATTFADYVSQFAYSRVDGTYASTASDVRAVVGSDTYSHMGGTYRHNNADDIALERLMAITGGIRVSAHVVEADSTNHRQQNVVRIGSRRDMVAPIWDGITLIPDEITKAANGQIVVMAVMLYAVKILRTSGFHKQQTQVQ